MIGAIPLRGFDSAKTRLAEELSRGARAAVAAAVAERVAKACRAAGWQVVIVSSAPDVVAWCADHRLDRLEDPGGGLNAAAAAATTEVEPWMVIHGDLPLVAPADLAGIAEAVRDGSVVLAPSRDGGTNVIAATSAFRFSYGPGSFARHLAAAPPRRPLTIVRAGLAVELDTPADLRATLRHPEGRWLAGFLS